MNQEVHSNVGTVFQTARPAFLPLSVFVVAAGAATARLSGTPIDWLMLAVVLVTAVTAHIAVNVINEYQDFTSGLDLLTERTPFSGGSGALPANPDASAAVATFSWISLGVLVVAGLWIVAKQGITLLPIGIVGVLIIVSYTRVLNLHPLACLLAPGIGFGPLMLWGTHLALGAPATPAMVLAGLMVLCSTSNLLLLNQLPDIEPDRQVGRRHLAIVHGKAAIPRACLLLLVALSAMLLLGLVSGAFPPLTLLVLTAVAAGFFAWRGLGRDAELGKALTANVLCALGIPLLLAVGIFLSLPIFRD